MANACGVYRGTPRLRRIRFHLQEAAHPGSAAAPGLRLHPLKGDRAGQWSVNVSGNWRVVFRFSASGGKPGGWHARCFPARSAYGYAKLNRRRSADLRAVRTGKPGDRSGEIAMTSFNEGRHETRTPGAALAAIAGRAKHGFAQGLTRAEGIPLGIMPDRRIAGSPDRRIAGSPDRRIAGSPDRSYSPHCFWSPPPLMRRR